MKSKAVWLIVCLVVLTVGIIFLALRRNSTVSDRRPTPVGESHQSKIPPAVKPKLPEIPVGDSDESAVLAESAAKVRLTIREMDKSKTQADARQYRRRIREHSKVLVEGGKASLPALDALLADPRVDVRMRAVSILGQIKKPYTVEPLCRVFLKDKYKAARTSALMYLAQIRPDKTMPKEVLIWRTRQVRFAALMDPDLDVRKMGQQLQWALTHRLEGYRADAPPAARQAALTKLQQTETPR